MKNGNYLRYLVIILFALPSLIASQAYSATPIAKITSFKGDAVIQAGTKFVSVKQIGQPVNTGDRIQTKKGEVELTFNDGAVLKVRPFTNTSVDEREEKSGFWVFKTKKPVRRLTCFVGKMRFKSGASKRENYLQTPTSVCALRGSDAAVGYNNIDSLLNMYQGEAAVTGKFLRGFFADPGISAAAKSAVYGSLTKANDAAQKAKTPTEQAKAQVKALEVVKEASKELTKNADPKVKEQAQLAGAAADAANGVPQMLVVRFAFPIFG